MAVIHSRQPGTSLSAGRQVCQRGKSLPPPLSSPLCYRASPRLSAVGPVKMEAVKRMVGKKKSEEGGTPSAPAGAATQVSRSFDLVPEASNAIALRVQGAGTSHNRPARVLVCAGRCGTTYAGAGARCHQPPCPGPHLSEYKVVSVEGLDFQLVLLHSGVAMCSPGSAASRPRCFLPPASGNICPLGVWGPRLSSTVPASPLRPEPPCSCLCIAV